MNPYGEGHTKFKVSKFCQINVLESLKYETGLGFAFVQIFIKVDLHCKHDGVYQLFRLVLPHHDEIQRYSSE